MSIYKEKPLDRTGLKTIPLAERPAKVTVSQFARPYQKGEGVTGLVESMPRILAGALIGRIGNGAPFPIGTQTAIPMPGAGQLFLGVNDDELSDNQGEFRVEVVQQVRRR